MKFVASCHNIVHCIKCSNGMRSDKNIRSLKIEHTISFVKCCYMLAIWKIEMQNTFCVVEIRTSLSGIQQDGDDLLHLANLLPVSCTAFEILFTSDSMTQQAMRIPLVFASYVYVANVVSLAKQSSEKYLIHGWPLF